MHLPLAHVRNSFVARIVFLSLAVATFGTVDFAASLLAQTQAPVPIRELSPPDATAAEHFANIFAVRQIANRHVLVNDGVRRQLSVLDANLANRTIVLDSISNGRPSYGPQAVPLIPYLGDSTFFADGVSRTLLLIDPSGKIARVASSPKAADLSFLLRQPTGVDARGNLIYRAFYAAYTAPPKYVNGVLDLKPMPDTAPIVRANFETRAVDTIGAIRIQPPVPYTTTTDANGKRTNTIKLSPLRVIDEWSVLSDGTLAMVRGHDYHVDFVQSDGTAFSAPRLPFDFRPLTDDDKQKLLDSAKAVEDARRAEAGAPESRARIVGGRGGISGEGPQAAANRPQVEYLPISEIPDYYPPIRMGATKADADGNLWILPTTSARSLKGELVYDVVNNRGVIIERVRLPVDRSIAGFGRGGVIYLMSKGSDNLWTLERTKVVRGR